MLAYIIPIRIKIWIYLRFWLHFTPGEYILILCESCQLWPTPWPTISSSRPFIPPTRSNSLISTHLDLHHDPDNLTLSVFRIDNVPSLSHSRCLTLAITPSAPIGQIQTRQRWHLPRIWTGPDKVGKQASAACKHRPKFVVLLIVNFVGADPIKDICL